MSSWPAVKETFSQKSLYLRTGALAGTTVMGRIEPMLSCYHDALAPVRHGPERCVVGVEVAG